MKEGFHIEAELVFVSDKKKRFKQPFPFTVNSLDKTKIPEVIEYWKKHLIERGDNRKLVVKKVFEIKRIK